MECTWRGAPCATGSNAAELLEPLAELQKALVLLSPILWTDDTPVTVLGGEEPGSSTGRFWVYIGDADHPYSVYDFTLSRARDGPAAFLKDYRGFLQADAYGGYDGIYLGTVGSSQVAIHPVLLSGGTPTVLQPSATEFSTHRMNRSNPVLLERRSCL